MQTIRKSQRDNPVCQRAAAKGLAFCDPYRDWRYAYFDDVHRVRENDPENGRYRIQPHLDATELDMEGNEFRWRSRNTVGPHHSFVPRAA